MALPNWVLAAGWVLALGLPLCWIILSTGMWDKGSSINSPLLSFEVSQSGYGMYVKYLMAGFLVIFAVTMLIQFVSYLLYNANQLLSHGEEEEHLTYLQLISGDKKAVSGGGH